MLIPGDEDNCGALSYPYPDGTYAYIDPHSGVADRVFNVPARQNYTLCAREDGEFVHHKHISFETHYEPCDFETQTLPICTRTQL